MNGKRTIRWAAVAAVAAVMVLPVAAQVAVVVEAPKGEQNEQAQQPPATGGVVRARPRVVQRSGGVAVFAAQARATSESSARYSTREGARLRMNAEIGSIRVTTVPGAQDVTVTMRVETDPRQPDAQNLLKQVTLGGTAGPDGTVHVVSRVPWEEFRGRLWVRFDVTTPRNYNLELTTHAGNISISDIDGRVHLVSHGGNIEAENVGASARMETQGGHVTVKNVGGELVALTAGGHVSAGHVAGQATLRTGGGHIRVASTQGVGNAETGGGDINVAKAGGKFFAVSEGGGQITFAEASGAIEARTAGGGIRVLKMTGPMQLNSAGGSIYLTRVSDAVRASTASGNITAWFTGDGKKTVASQLQCTEQGDIVVYLPRQMALNIDATIEGATNHQVTWDPAMTIRMIPAEARQPGARGRLIRASGAVNGGGETLRLRTVGGNIRLAYADQAQRGHGYRVELRQDGQQTHVFQGRRLEPHEVEALAQHRRAAIEQRAVEHQQQQGRVAALRAMLEHLFSRTVRVDPAAQRERLKVSVVPTYPQSALNGRVEGVVQLEAVISEEGKVVELEAVAGHPLLVQAALDAVRQWQYEPTVVNNRAVRVVTRIDVQFKLN